LDMLTLENFRRSYPFNPAATLAPEQPQIDGVIDGFTSDEFIDTGTSTAYIDTDGHVAVNAEVLFEQDVGANPMSTNQLNSGTENAGQAVTFAGERKLRSVMFYINRVGTGITTLPPPPVICNVYDSANTVGTDAIPTGIVRFDAVPYTWRQLSGDEAVPTVFAFPDAPALAAQDWAFTVERSDANLGGFATANTVNMFFSTTSVPSIGNKFHNGSGSTTHRMFFRILGLESGNSTDFFLVTKSCPALTARSAPDTTTLTVIANLDGGAINVDLIANLSRDGGTTQTAAVLVDHGFYDEALGLRIYHAVTDISAQPSDVDMQVSFEGNDTDLTVIAMYAFRWPAP